MSNTPTTNLSLSRSGLKKKRKGGNTGVINSATAAATKPRRATPLFSAATERRRDLAATRHGATDLWAAARPSEKHLLYRVNRQALTVHRRSWRTSRQVEEGRNRRTKAKSKREQKAEHNFRRQGGGVSGEKQRGHNHTHTHNTEKENGEKKSRTRSGIHR